MAIHDLARQVSTHQNGQRHSMITRRLLTFYNDGV